VQLLVRPVLSDISESQEQLDSLTQEYETLVQQSNSYDQNMAVLEDWEEKNQTATKRLYPLSSPERIDHFLTCVMGECGVTVKSLSISDVQQYYVDAENQLILADPELVAEAQTGTTAEDVEQSAYTATGEYRRDFAYTIEGSYANMVQMLQFVSDIDFLGVSDFSFSSISETGQTALGDSYTFTLTITTYMYHDPLQSTQSEEEEEDTSLLDDVEEQYGVEPLEEAQNAA
jgi:hypothetical protein